MSDKAIRKAWKEEGLLKRKRRKHKTKNDLREIKAKWRLFQQTDVDTTAGRMVFSETHDVTWGPGYVTALGVQWQDGELKAVWPPPDGSWNDVVYGGTVEYQLPPWVVDHWTQ